MDNKAKASSRKHLVLGALAYSVRPDIKPMVRAVGDVFAILVYLIGIVFLNAGLLNRSHPVFAHKLRGFTGLARVLIDATEQIRPQWRSLPQLVVYYAVLGVLISTVAVGGLKLFELSIGLAEASSAQQIADSGSIFSETNDGREIGGSRELNKVFDFNGDAGGRPEGFQNLAASLGEIVGLYSYGALVLAGIIIGYIVVVIVADTAKTGRMFGSGRNEVWGVIRILVALSFLIPVGVGFNVGQAAVVQVAKWGSGMGTQVWNLFLVRLNEAYDFTPNLKVPDVANVAARYTQLETCRHASNMYSMHQDGYCIIQRVQRESSDGIHVNYDRRPKHTGAEGDGLGSLIDHNYCGKIVYAQAQSDESTLEWAYSFWDNSNRHNDARQRSYSTKLRERIAEAQREAFDSIQNSVELTAMAAASIYMPSRNAGKTCMADGSVFDFVNSVGANHPALNVQRLKTSIVDAYRKALIDRISAVMDSGEVQAEIEEHINRTSGELGWLSGGAWFFELARLNNAVQSASMSIPRIENNNTANIAGDSKAMHYLDRAVGGDLGGNLLSRAWDGLWSGNLLGSVSDAMVSEEAARIQALAQTHVNTLFRENMAALELSEVAETHYTGGAVARGVTMVKWGADVIEGNIDLSLGLFERYYSLLSINTLLESFKDASANPMQRLVEFGHAVEEVSLIVLVGALVVALIPGGYAGATLILFAIGTMLFTSAITFSIILPLLPSIRFLFGILTWLLAVFESVIAIPVIALSHMRTEGSGLPGPMAQAGYMLVLQIMLRPVLMVFGLIGGLLMFNLAIQLLVATFAMAVANIETNSLRGFLHSIAYIVIFTGVCYSVANLSFKAIHMLPENVLRWMGSSGFSSLSDTDATRRSGVAAAGAAAGIVGGHMADRLSRYQGIGSKSGGGGMKQSPSSSGKSVSGKPGSSQTQGNITARDASGEGGETRSRDARRSQGQGGQSDGGSARPKRSDANNPMPPSASGSRKRPDEEEEDER